MIAVIAAMFLIRISRTEVWEIWLINRIFRVEK